MVTMELDNFSLEQICDSGQCFRMKKTGENTYSLVAGNQYLEVSQKGSIVDFNCSDTELICFWVPYFDLDADYSAYIEKVNPRDKYLSAAAAHGSGIRILQQDLWEMIVTFLISQQNNISRIRGCIERLCARYGEKRISGNGVEYYGFPGPEILAEATEQELRELGLGYRARYIAETARTIVQGEISLEKIYRMRYYNRAKNELMKLCGVGEKVADCICLFALHHMDAFPVDTHIRQVLDEHYREDFQTADITGSEALCSSIFFIMN